MTAVDPLADIDDAYVLSPLQLGMLYQTIANPGSGVFYQQVAAPLPLGTDVQAFERAWEEIVGSTAVLRTSFHWEDLEQPVQIVHRDVAFGIERLDWSRTPTRSFRRRIDEHLAVRRAEGFDLSRAPLMRVDVVTAPARSNWFVWHFHHLLLDGWSSRNLLDELFARYRALVAGQPYRAPARPPFRDYIQWLAHQDQDGAEAYWRSALHGVGAPTALALPKADGRACEIVVELADESTAALVAFARVNHVTLNTVLQGAWAGVLSRLGDTDDVVFGTVVSGRSPEIRDVERIIGLFINSLPTRVRLDPDAELGSWLRALQVEQARASRFDFVSPLQVSRWSGMAPDTRLYDTVLILENFPNAQLGSDGAQQHGQPLDFGQTDLPLSIMVLPGERLRMTLRSDGRVVDAASLQVIGDELAALLRRIPAATHTRVADVVVGACAPTTIAPPWSGPTESRSVIELFDLQVRLTPDLVPFRQPGGWEPTLAEFDARSHDLAAALIERGVVPGDAVGVHLPRSAEFVMAVLAIFRIRAVYVPLDPNLPAARIRAMLDAAGSRVVVGRGLGTSNVTSNVTSDVTSDVTRVEMVTPETAGPDRHRRPVMLPAPDDAAYVLFTSGSTGRPKGVTVEHRTISNRLSWMWRTMPFEPGEAGMVRTSCGFVDALWEMLGAMLVGVPSVIADDDAMADPALLLDLARRYGATRVFLVPSYLAALLERCPDVAARAPDLRLWLVGGEPLTGDLARRFGACHPSARLVNIYGSTELWDVIATTVDADLARADMVPAGRPIDGVRIAIVDSRDRPVLPGMIGRLCVTGAALPRGYLDQDVTTSQFPTIDVDGRAVRFFDTGDLAHCDADGVLHLHGRRDLLIKVRGVRADPVEVESAIEQHDAIAEAAVVLHTATADRTGATERLVAFVAANSEARSAQPDDAALRAFLSERLPRAVIPSRFVRVDAIPHTTSGKKDRHTLASAPLPSDHVDTDPHEVDDRVERIVADAMADLLQIAQIGRQDDFFTELGGHSLLAVRLAARLESALGIDVSVRDVFEHPTVVHLARRLSHELGSHEGGVVDDLLAELAQLEPEAVEALLDGLADPEDLA